MTGTLVIVNPAAGGGRGARAEPEITRIFESHGHPAEFVHSKSSEDAEEQARCAARRGVQCVAALGGDGLFHHVVNGIIGADCIVAFFPAGNGNDIAKALGIPGDPVQAAELFLRMSPRTIDVVRVRFADGRSTYYVGAGGMGLDAEAALQANTRFRHWPGILRYLAGALWTFGHEPSFNLRAEADGVAWTGKAILAAVANSSWYGSGIRIAPEAVMDDGLLNIALVEELGWLRLLHGLSILVANRELKFKEVKRFTARRVLLNADRSVRIHGDGEHLGESPAEFEILPGAIRVMAPK
jgi:diacylglycerol kinase (ATP)